MKLNDAPILDQLDGEWQKIAMMILWHFNGDKIAKITMQEIADFTRKFAPGMPVMFTNGHHDSIEFQIVDEDAAARIAAHQALQAGRA